MSGFRSYCEESKIYEKDGLEFYDTTVHMEGITRPVTIYVSSDVHIAHLDLEDGLARRHFVTLRRIYFPDAPDVFDSIIDITKRDKPDYSIMLGDTADFPSDANLRQLSRFKDPCFGPYLGVFGNHDDNYPEEKATYDERLKYREKLYKFTEDDLGIYRDVTPEHFKNGKYAFRAVDLGEVIIAGGDNVRPEGRSAIKEAIEELKGLGKPIILCMHVPVSSDSLDPKINVIWKTNSRKPALSEYCDEKAVSLVLTGHVHFFANCVTQDGTPQLVFTSTENKSRELDKLDGLNKDWPCFWGGMGVVRLVPITG